MEECKDGRPVQGESRFAFSRSLPHSHSPTLPFPHSSSRPLRIAVVGGGVAGLTAAWLLSRRHHVTLYERNGYIGGHTRTFVVPDGPDAGTPVDTGFIVMNHRNYPLFTRVLRLLDIPLGESDMSFSYHCRGTGYVYAGTNLRTLFARKRSVVSPLHWRMLADILRFNREATAEFLGGRLNGETLQEYLEARNYSEAFAHHYLFALGSAIWSSPHANMGIFPVRAFVQFFANHGLLSLRDRPRWKYVQGGARRYVEAMLRSLKDSVQVGRPVLGIARVGGAVVIETEAGRHRCDAVVIGAHADQALAMLRDPSGKERRLLGAWQYQANTAALHSYSGMMPPRRRAWASWNFRREREAGPGTPVSITYHMNRLQRLRTQCPYFVTLNRVEQVPDDAVLDRTIFRHPVYTRASMATQSELSGLNGERNTFYCGSYFGYGFHEDAVRSAVRVAEQLGVGLCGTVAG